MSDPNQGSSPARRDKPARDRKRDARLVLTGIVSVLLVWFALGNLQQVEIHFWLVSSRASLISVIVISGVLGVAIGVLFSRRRGHRGS